jgi:DNA repair exonuclease SbcCD nuclease subunit
MSRLLLVSDIHFNQAAFRWIAERARKDGMAVAIAGDLMDLNRCSTEKDARRQQDWISAWLREVEPPLFVCSGNHDLYPSHDRSEWLLKAKRPGVAVDGDVVVWSGRTVALCPFCPAGLNPMLERLATGTPPDVLLHHEPPTETRLSMGRRDYADFGSDQLSSALRSGWAPKTVVSGHIHRATARHQFVGDALCLNVAGDPRLSPPSHAILDADTGVVEFFEPAPRGLAMNPSW